MEGFIIKSSANSKALLSYEEQKRLSNHRIIVVGQRISDFISLLRITHVEAMIVCEDEQQTNIFGREVITISYETVDHWRKNWNNKSLDELVDIAVPTIKILESISNVPISIVMYAASREWYNFAKLSDGHIRIIAPSVDTKDLIDNKIFTRFSLKEYNLPVPESIKVQNKDLDFTNISNLLGVPFVLQTPVGSSGTGTYLVENNCIMEEIKNGGYSKIWLASRYIGEITINVHGLVLQNSINVSLPSVQVSGVKELSNNWGTYCGSDFLAGQNLCLTIKERIQNLAESVGRWLLDFGYEGIYGVDMILSKENVYIVEVNPRMQGSTWLLSEIELSSGRTPLVVKNILWHLEAQKQFKDAKNVNLIGASYLILHSIAKTQITIQHDLRSGAYTIDNFGKLQWQHECIGLIELGVNEILIFGLPFHQGAKIEPGSVMARIASKQQLVSNDGHKLTSIGQKVIKAINYAFKSIK